MQESFGFAVSDVARWRGRLGPVVLPRTRRTPVGQLVKSIISARTRDVVSLRAHHRLGQAACRWDVPACGVCPLAEDCVAGRRSGVSAAS